MPTRRQYDTIMEAVEDISNELEKWLTNDGQAWLVGKLRTNIVRTVYRRTEKTYKRTGAFKESVRGRVFNKGQYLGGRHFEVVAYPDPQEMQPHHTSWVKGQYENQPVYKNTNIDENISEWLDQGHAIYNQYGQKVGHYKGAMFMRKTEAEVEDAKGFSRLMTAHFNRLGFFCTNTYEAIH